MATPGRTDFEGAWHYVFRRGRGGDLFSGALDALAFFQCCRETLERFDVQVHAYGLTSTEYRLLLRSGGGRLSSAMQSLGFRYARWLRLHRGRTGRLYAGRFGSRLLLGEAQLMRTVAFLHRAPLEAGLVADLRQPAWTSHRAYLEIEPPPEWLTTEVLLDLFGGQAALHRFVEGAGGAAALGAPIVFGAADLDACMADVCCITGVDREDLTRTTFGQGGNPARRFAIWALVEDGRWSQRDIACALRTSPSNVATTMARLRRGRRTAELGDWIRAWRQQEGTQGA